MSSRPNIVLIMTDQQRFDTISALGFPHMHTPNLDRLVNEGVSFDNCFVAAPSCAPSRASFFTGSYPHTNGVYKNADRWSSSWVSRLSEAGYHCVNVGKMHTFPYEEPLGFHERFVVENKDRYLEGRYFLDRWDLFLQAQGLVKQQRELYRKRSDYTERMGAFEWELPPHTQSDMFVGDLAAWWLDTKPVDKPLFLQIGFPGPHPPYDPVPEYLHYYSSAEVPLPSVTEAELERQPEALKILRDHNCAVDHDSVVWSKSPTEEQLLRLRKHYLANVTMIDEQVGAIVEALERRDILDNTVIVFTSDHGDCLGDHGQIQKWTMFEEIVRVPAIIWNPRLLEGGSRLPVLCQQFDIAATLFELAGVDAPDHWEAQSLIPQIEGEEKPHRAFVFAEQAWDGIFTGTAQMTMIRDPRWKLVHYADETGEGELYDLASDPGEHRNLWASPDHETTRSHLLAKLLQWKIESDLRTHGQL